METTLICEARMLFSLNNIRLRLNVWQSYSMRLFYLRKPTYAFVNIWPAYKIINLSALVHIEYKRIKCPLRVIRVKLHDIQSIIATADVLRAIVYGWMTWLTHIYSAQVLGHTIITLNITFSSYLPPYHVLFNPFTPK